MDQVFSVFLSRQDLAVEWGGVGHTRLCIQIVLGTLYSVPSDLRGRIGTRRKSDFTPFDGTLIRRSWLQNKFLICETEKALDPIDFQVFPVLSDVAKKLFWDPRRTVNSR